MASGSAQWIQSPSWLPVWSLVILSAFLLSLGIAIRIARPQGRWGRLLRKRFFLGVPWGTLLTVCGVAGVYVFLQGGWEHPNNPLVLPFRSWSYLYPLGILTASFTHAGMAHLTGNLLGTLTFAPLIEYAWGHFPRGRGSNSFGSLRTNPFARILVVPVVVFVVGIFVSVFAVGPVIGFSGVVFAFAGAALVYYPIPTVIVLAGSETLRLVSNAIRNPVTVTQAGPQFVTPWWANIAIQGHALGLFCGIAVGGLLAKQRDHRPSPGRLWLATVVLAVAQSLWALYWFRGGVTYVLFRAAGVAAVFLLAALVTAAITATDNVLVGTLNVGSSTITVDLRSREAAVGLFVAFTIALSIIAVPVNLATVGETNVGNDVQVRDYTVTYAENTPHEYVSVFNISLFGETTRINTSGVIVVSEQRRIFRTAVQKRQLAYQGNTRVIVGGVGWRRTVLVNRTGWDPVGNASVYKVFLNPDRGQRQLVFRSEPKTAEPTIAGREITVTPRDTAYGLVVTADNQTLGQTNVPTAGHNVTAGDLTFNKTDGSIFALQNGTRVRIVTEADGRQ